MRHSSLLMGRRWLHLLTQGHRSPAWAEAFANGWPWRSTPRQAARARGDWRPSHLILGICRGYPADPGYKGLQLGHLAAGHTDHDLFWEGTSHVGVQDYWQGNGNAHKRELARAIVTWKQAYFVAVMSGSPQLPCRATRWDGDAVKGVTPSADPNPTSPRKFCLDDVQKHVGTTQSITIPLSGTINWHGNTNAPRDSMWVHMFVKPEWGPSCPLLLYQLPHMESYTHTPPCVNLLEEL